VDAAHAGQAIKAVCTAFAAVVLGVWLFIGLAPLSLWVAPPLSLWVAPLLFLSAFLWPDATRRRDGWRWIALGLVLAVAVAAVRGAVAQDETWIGGKPSNRHADKRNPNAGPGVTDKQPVMTLVDYETRAVRSRAVADVIAPTLAHVIAEEVEIDRSQLWTDSSASYRTVGKRFNSHHTVNHSAGEYVCVGAGTNLAEGYFAQLKRSLDGTHHHVSREHLNRYLAQFDWLYIHCKATDSERMRLLLT